MTEPVIRHTNNKRIKQRLNDVAFTFFQRELPKTIARFTKEFDGDPFSLDALLALRKRLRDETREALIEKDDKVMRLLRTGEYTQDGHEPTIVLLSILIHHLIDEQFRQISAGLRE